MSVSSASGKTALQSNSSPRVVRGENPKRKAKQHNYREVTLPSLRRDFADRCAYSMQHLEFGGGDKCMEVDHFNCTLPKLTRNRYENLFLASRHCNGAKSDTWPTAEQEKRGMRFLNCCEEGDYGEVIFEDPSTHEVWGTTLAAKYHILHCDLNRDHLVKERRRRAIIRQAMQQPAYISEPEEVKSLLGTMVETVDKMIPSIPFRSKPKKAETLIGKAA